MKHSTHELFRKIFHSNKLLERIYAKASAVKTEKNKKYSDEEFLARRYKENMGKDIDLVNPRGFNEKLLWLQLHDRNPLYTLMSDKYRVKEYVKNSIGEEYVVPCYGMWERAEDIPFDSLPEECVLKCNHDCGSVYIKKKGESWDKKKIIHDFGAALKKNYYYVGRVWGYKDIKPCIFCEGLIKTENGKPPRDYKIFCFDGTPRFAFVASDRGEGTKFDFFDLEWNKIPVKQHYPNSSYVIPKPEKWDEMLSLASKLSKGIPHVRVDFYIDADGQVLFGELTFCHFSGKEKFEPESYDELFGSYIDLSKVRDHE